MAKRKPNIRRYVTLYSTYVRKGRPPVVLLNYRKYFSAARVNPVSVKRVMEGTYGRSPIFASFARASYRGRNNVNVVFSRGFVQQSLRV